MGYGNITAVYINKVGSGDMVIFNDLPRKDSQSSDNTGQSRLADAIDSAEERLRSAINRKRQILWRWFMIMSIFGLVAWISSMFRYEVIVVPQREQYYTVQYLVKDRWTGEIEAVWQDARGKVIQSRHHVFDNNLFGAMPNFIPKDEAHEVPNPSSQN